MTFANNYYMMHEQKIKECLPLFCYRLSNQDELIQFHKNVLIFLIRILEIRKKEDSLIDARL